MKDKTERSARFRTVIALIIDGKEHQFDGIAEGEITHIPSGEGGFGYDPVFQPQGEERTFAMLSIQEKNEISHRGKAIKALINFLSAGKF
jgi:XTP/dITP diphosphohydrolase